MTVMPARCSLDHRFTAGVRIKLTARRVDRESEPHVRAAGWPAGGPRVAVVRPRDAAHDRQSQTAAVRRPGTVRASKALKGLVNEIRGESGSLIGDVKLHVLTAARSGERDCSAAVAQRIVDHVGQRLLDTRPISGQLNAIGRRYREGSTGSVSLWAKTLRDAGHKLGER